MKTDYRLDFIFGQSGKFAAILLIIAGILTLLQYIGIILIVFGLFLLTYSGTEFDSKKKTFRTYNCLFGFYKVGKTLDLSMIHGLKVAQARTGFRTNSRTNLSYNFTQTDFRVVMIGHNKKLRFPVAKFKTLEEATAEMKKLSLLINLPLI